MAGPQIKFYLDAVLRTLQFGNLISRTDTFDLVDINNQVYTPKSPITPADISATIPNSFWIKTIDSDHAQFMYGNKMICVFNPTTGNIIYGLGNISNVPISKGGTGSGTAADARNALGIGTAGVLHAGTGAGDVLLLSQANKLPVLDASNLTNLPTLPSGLISYFASSTPPAGWLKCNGSLLLRSAYTGLFSAIGETWGAGDGSTSFRAPDLRGYFLRAWTDGAALDAGRVFGSIQNNGIPWPTFGQILRGAGQRVDGYQDGYDDFLYVPQQSTGNGVEVRPENIALLACIKI